MIFSCSIDFIFGSWALLKFSLRSDVCFGSLKIDDVNPDVVQLFWTAKDDWVLPIFVRAVRWNLASHNQDSVLILELFTIPRVHLHLLWHFHLQLREIHLEWHWQYEKLWNQHRQRNNEKLESLNLSSMPLKTPTFKNPKQKTPKRLI
jgi:hypothetical protein